MSNKGFVGFLFVQFALFSVLSHAQVYREGEVIVKLKGDAKSTSAASFVGKVQMEKQMSLSKSWMGMNLHHFKASSGHTTQELLEMYKADPAVQYVEPNYVFSKMDVQEADSVTGLSESQAQASSSSGGFSHNTAPIQAEDAWSVLSANAAAKPIVAIIDTGVDYGHTVFQQSSAIWQNDDEIAGNGLDDDGNGYVDDIRGWNFVGDNNDPSDDNNHGTHVAGIVLGIGQDIVSTVPRAESRILIMPLKFLDSQGSGATSDAIEAIHYAVNNGAKILNNSWGGPSYSAALHEAVAYAYSAKAFFVAAAGNSSSNNDSTPIYPAGYNVPGLAAIASTTNTDSLSFFSNFGLATVHVGSPGSSIKSTLPGDTFGFLSGTSMAAPAVSGIAALMMFEKPDMNGFQIKNIIFSGSNSVVGLSGKVNTESRINVFNAVRSAQTSSVDPSQPAYTISVDQFSRDLASAMDGGAACGLVKALGSSSGALPYLTLILLALPFALYLHARVRKTGSNRRRHDRFVVDTEVAIAVGDRMLSGRVNSISTGGARFQAEDLIERGSVVTMIITSPDGSGRIEVQGNIVWSEQNQQCGVQFSPDKLVKATVEAWTRDLKKEAL